jgi:eukaryotic-like serine/threonine-protein kinase
VDRPANDVKAIFIADLDHEQGADRAAFLDAACGDNAEVRRRVEAFLAAHDRADEILGKNGEPADETVTVDSNEPRSENVVSSWQASATAD